VIFSAGKYRKVPHLVVDEAQDLPPAVFPLLPLVAENLTIFADENQKLTDSNAMIQDIKRALGLRETHELRRNYRNTRQIALVAKEYYTGGVTGIPDLPEREGDVPWLIQYPTRESQAKAILQYERNNPDREIGVLVHSNARGAFLEKQLRGQTVNPVQQYASGEGLDQMSFDMPGIRILNHQSAKGLEFDTVFLPFLNEWRPAVDAVSARMKMYVMTSRARIDLRMLYSGQQLPVMVRDLPSKLYQYREVDR
jgi:superfamily I DNA/RNA helicase